MKKAFEILKWLMLITVIILQMAFTFKQQENVTCKQFAVFFIETDNHFINKEMIDNLLIMQNLHPFEKSNKEIAIAKIEQTITNHFAVKTANVYSDVAGNISVEIRQRKPIARVVNEKQSYYIDEEGVNMPLSDHFTARTLIISGNLALIDNKGLVQVARYIYKNPFWKAQIMQIYVEENKDLTLIPRVGYHQIVFGELENIEEKFSNLKLFYQKGIAYQGWNSYSHINLKFKNQIVCVKK